MKKLPYFLLFCFLQTINVTIVAQISTTGTIVSGGLEREYRIYKPAIYDGNTPVPLLLNFHGYSSNNLQQEIYGSFKNIADTANFLIVLPNGTLDAQGNAFWNVFNGPYAVDDIAFVGDLLDTLQALYNIDVNRIYSTGMSNGGFMSHTLACKMNDRIAAIAAVAGTITNTYMSTCNPNRPIPVMHIHGTADDVVPYSGLTLVNGLSVQNTVDKWVTKNNCNPAPAQTNVPNTNTGDGCTAERYVYSGGDNGSTVELYKIVAGGHTWPGAIFPIGVTNQDMDASKEIWRFLSQYHLDQLVDAHEPTTTQPTYSISPNPAHSHMTIQGSFQQISLVHSSGQLMLSVLNASDLATFTVENWPKGLYLAYIKGAEGQSSVQKFIVE